MNRHTRFLVPLTLFSASSVWAQSATSAGGGPVGRLLMGTGAVALALLVEIGLLSLVILAVILRPATIRAGTEELRTRPVRTFLAGVLAMIVLTLAAILLSHLPEASRPLLALLLAALFGFWAVCGGAMVCGEIGDRLQANVGAGTGGITAWSVFWGSVLIVTAGFVPILGQLVQLVVLLLALGAGISAELGRLERKPVSGETPPGTDSSQTPAP
mgnify:CR=1 FL=1